MSVHTIHEWFTIFYKTGLTVSMLINTALADGPDIVGGPTRSGPLAMVAERTSSGVLWLVPGGSPFRGVEFISDMDLPPRG